MPNEDQELWTKLGEIPYLETRNHVRPYRCPKAPTQGDVMGTE